MPTLTNYNQFAGTHWETGTVRNFLAQRGFSAPHTGEPYSEALLLGAGALLPDEIEPFAETRRLMWRKHMLFLEQGGEARTSSRKRMARLIGLNPILAKFLSF